MIKYGEKTFFIESSPYKGVDLNELGFQTKPDFTLYNDDGSYAGFIYTDGAGPHLNPESDEPTFVNDIKIRDALHKQEKVPVITLTYNMLQELWTYVAASKDLSEDYAYELDKNDYQNTDGVLSHRLLAKHSLYTLYKVFDLITEGKRLNKDEGPVYQSLVMEYQNNGIVRFEGSTFNILTDQDIRAQRKDNNLVVSPNYELHWSNFWYVFNIYSIQGADKIPFKFKVE